jgi:hypothetical protein
VSSNEIESPPCPSKELQLFLITSVSVVAVENKNILTEEIESWNRFEYALRQENRLLFRKMLGECRNRWYTDCVNAKGENFSAESLFLILILQPLSQNGGSGGIAINGGIASGASGSTSGNGYARNGGIAIGVGSVADGTSGNGNGNGQGGGVAINWGSGHTHQGCSDAIGSMCFYPP